MKGLTSVGAEDGFQPGVLVKISPLGPASNQVCSADEVERPAGEGVSFQYSVVRVGSMGEDGVGTSFQYVGDIGKAETIEA